MFVTADTKMSGLLVPDSRIALAYQPGAYDVRYMKSVPVRRIDDLVPTDAAVGLMKIDVQGFELSALRGAAATLKRTKAICIEVNFVSHYEGAVEFDELHSFLTREGFKLHGISPAHFGMGRPLWADAIYVARSDQN